MNYEKEPQKTTLLFADNEAGVCCRLYDESHMKNLDYYRNKYAQLVSAKGGVDPENRKLVSAFASVRREGYLGPGPWEIRTGAGYKTTPSDDPSCLYQDVLVALDREEGINNGQPSLHAGCMDALKICAGETILHIGAGTGYYTAILAELTGPSGTVIAYEINEALCKRAAENLAARSNIRVQGCSGTVGTLPDCDVIYVNAGVTGPPAAWLDALGPHGRVIFPLTSTLGTGRMLLLKRVDEVHFTARFTGPVGFIPCIGARDEIAAFKLADAFTEGGARDVKSFHRGNTPDETCCFFSDSWWLSTSSVD